MLQTRLMPCLPPSSADMIRRSHAQACSALEIAPAVGPSGSSPFLLVLALYMTRTRPPYSEPRRPADLACSRSFVCMGMGATPSLSAQKAPLADTWGSVLIPWSAWGMGATPALSAHRASLAENRAACPYSGLHEVRVLHVPAVHTGHCWLEAVQRAHH